MECQQEIQLKIMACSFIRKRRWSRRMISPYAQTFMESIQNKCGASCEMEWKRRNWRRACSFFSGLETHSGDNHNPRLWEGNSKSSICWQRSPLSSCYSSNWTHHSEKLKSPAWWDPQAVMLGIIPCFGSAILFKTRLLVTYKLQYGDHFR